MPKSTAQTTRHVLTFMRNHPGTIYHYQDVADALSLEGANVNAALGRMHTRHPEYGVVREGSGQYVFYPSRQGTKVGDTEPEKTGPMMYEEIGTAQDGTIIVRNEKGILYRIGDVL